MEGREKEEKRTKEHALGENPINSYAKPRGIDSSPFPPLLASPPPSPNPTPRFPTGSSIRARSESTKKKKKTRLFGGMIDRSEKETKQKSRVARYSR